jgi:hypothetical protein
MKYKFKDREQLIKMYNSIPTPHSHIIKLEGNSVDIIWDGKEPEAWKEYKIKKNDKSK